MSDIGGIGGDTWASLAELAAGLVGAHGFELRAALGFGLGHRVEDRLGLWVNCHRGLSLIEWSGGITAH
jgi:hypothetical protein